jgi:benzodiazapine receptor
MGRGTMKIDWVKLFAAIVVCQLAGVAGSFFTFPSVGTWYAGLVKPSFSPPNWVFGPVWIALYALMGVALYIVWQKGPRKKEVRTALAVFGVQLLLNSLWSVVFFGLHLPSVAFFEIVMLWASIAATIFLFYGISRNAAYLLVPYFVWVSFASLLNFSIWMLNA